MLRHYEEFSIIETSEREYRSKKPRIFDSQVWDSLSNAKPFSPAKKNPLSFKKQTCWPRRQQSLGGWISRKASNRNKIAWCTVLSRIKKVYRRHQNAHIIQEWKEHKEIKISFILHVNKKQISHERVSESLSEKKTRSEDFIENCFVFVITCFCNMKRKKNQKS